ncbi:MAG: TetR/AcrR family transcriptional regulator [Thermoplasmata archaeon]
MAREPNGADTKPNSTRGRILDAALQVFAEKGFAGATTKDIARMARVNEVTLFRLFKSKKALFNAVVAERSPLAQIRRSVSLDSNHAIDDLMVQNVRTVLETLRSNKHLYMVMLGDSWRQPKTKTSAYAQPFLKEFELVTAFMQSQMDAGKLRKIDPKVAARAWMGAVQFYFLTSDLIGADRLTKAEEDRLIRGFVDLFLNGMRSEGGTRL